MRRACAVCVCWASEVCALPEIVRANPMVVAKAPASCLVTVRLLPEVFSTVAKVHRRAHSRCCHMPSHNHAPFNFKVTYGYS